MNQNPKATTKNNHACPGRQSVAHAPHLYSMAKPNTRASIARIHSLRLREGHASKHPPGHYTHRHSFLASAFMHTLVMTLAATVYSNVEDMIIGTQTASMPDTLCTLPYTRKVGIRTAMEYCMARSSEPVMWVAQPCDQHNWR